MTTASQAFLSTAAPRSSRASCRGVVRSVFNLLKVETMGRDVPLDRGRHLAVDRSPLLDVMPDPARRIIGRALEAKEPGIAVEAASLEVRRPRRPAARTRHHH